MPDAARRAPGVSPGLLDLVPLRIPAGWRIGWNTLYASSRAENGDFGGSSLFHATHEAQRFNLDVEFRPEFDPDGEFHLAIAYQRWPRTERGRRRQDVPLVFDADAETVHRFATRSYALVIAELEQWLARCAMWTIEGN